MKRRVYFVGPLPPPVGGFSTINQHVNDRLRAADCELITYDVAPRVKRFPIAPLLAFAAARGARRGDSLYVALSGGLRQVFDACFIALARRRGLRIFIHHHSFAYINRKSRLAALTFWLAGRGAQHVVLCSTMRMKLAGIYGLDMDHVRSISNAAFMEKTANPRTRTGPSDGHIVLGYIGYLTEEKGIFHFIELCRKLIDRGAGVSAVIAGPGAPAAVLEMKRRIESYPGIAYVGVVSGEAKENFFRAIDWLVFPSSYINEAEPLVLWEAQSRGVSCIATDVGCVKCVVPDELGVHQSPLALVEYLLRPDSLALMIERHYFFSDKSKDKFCLENNSSSLKLDFLIKEISTQSSLSNVNVH